jgi:S-adenosylmethionine:tRNA ribosyltransferase-isomerase
VSATLLAPALDFELPAERIATGPIEAEGRRRDHARLLVARRSSTVLDDVRFADLPGFLHAGDVLVVNDSATLPAAVPTTDGRLVHLSTELPGGLWTVELREPAGAGSLPLLDGAAPGDVVGLPGGGALHLLSPYPADAGGAVRLWVARLALPTPLLTYLDRFGRPIRYGVTDRAWPLRDYQTVFARVPGSAEMPSASRGFTPELVAALAARGVVLAPITLHTGVSSQEAGEPPYAERYVVPTESADLVNAARSRGHRVIAVGTTATRAIETVADRHGVAHPGRGWTELVVTPERGVRVVDGLVTGWHEPRASHLALLEAVAGRPTVERSYGHALASGYRWHEFGDFHLVLPA